MLNVFCVPKTFFLTKHFGFIDSIHIQTSIRQFFSFDVALSLTSLVHGMQSLNDYCPLLYILQYNTNLMSLKSTYILINSKSMGPPTFEYNF